MPESAPLSPRVIGRLHAVLPPIEALLFDWAGALNDRITPLPAGVVSHAAGLLDSARKIVSRDAAAAHIPYLKPGAAVPPGEIFIALLMASTTLAAFAARHGVEV